MRAASPEPLSTPAKDLRSDTWTATDALGRALPGFDECGPRKGNRVVGMFYFYSGGTAQISLGDRSSSK